MLELFAELYPDPALRALFERVLGTGEVYHAAASGLSFLQPPAQTSAHWQWTLQPLREGPGPGPVQGLLLGLIPDPRPEKAVPPPDAG